MKITLYPVGANIGCQFPGCSNPAARRQVQDDLFFATFWCLVHAPDLTYDAACIEDALRDEATNAQDLADTLNGILPGVAAHVAVDAHRVAESLRHIIDVMNGHSWVTVTAYERGMGCPGDFE